MPIDHSRFKPGDILAERNNGVFGFFMRLFKQKVQHIVLVDRDPRYGLESSSPLVRRFLLRTETPYIHLRTDCSEETIEAALSWAEAQIGKIRYGYENLAMLAVMRIFGIEKRPWKDADDRNMMVCSEYASEAFFRAGDDLFPDLEDQDIRPDHYLENLRIHIVQE